MRIHALLLWAATAGYFAALAAPTVAQTPHQTLICKPGKTVAASVYGLWMGSGAGGSGDDPTIVQYPKTVTNIGEAWDETGHTTFTAPCLGTYTFSIVFVRDSTVTNSTCGPSAGTSDDIYVQLWRQPFGGGDPERIGSEKGAWAGATTSDSYRATGSYTVSARLQQGDQIYTLVLSDAGKFRCLASANLDIHKIGR